MTKRKTNKPGSIFPLLLGSILAAGASYVFVGTSSFYGMATLVMIAIVFTLGSSNQIKRGNALWVNILLGGIAASSIVMLSMNMGGEALIARTIAFIIFAFVGLSAFGTLLKIVFSIAGIFLMVFLVGYAMKTVDEQAVAETPLNNDNTAIEEHEALPHPENDQLLSHIQNWRDYDFNKYQGKLEIWESAYQQSHQYKNKKFRPKNTQEASIYWGSVYSALIRNDKEYMERILDAFIQIGRSNKLNELAFVQTIVSCIQSIPYVLIYRSDCSELAQKNPSLAELARTHSCKGNVSYGLQSPTEFMQDMKGDCDTRTVFLFTVLDQLGYKVAILNSDVYGHSMLGVAVPATGKYKSHRGTKYYFWETTAQGWNIGTLPPEMGQIKHWYVVLAN